MPPIDQRPHHGAITVNEFCLLYKLSRAKLYALWADKRGPKYKQVGAKRLISISAAEAWLESESDQTVAA